MNKLKEASDNSQPAQRWFWEVMETPNKEMSYGVKAVAGVIAACAWGNKDYSFPSYRSIADALGGASHETIRNGISKLEKFGFLAISKVKTPAGQRNHYRLTHPLATDAVEGWIVMEEVASVSRQVATDASEVATDCPPTLLQTGVAEALKEATIEAVIEASSQGEEEIRECGVSLDSKPARAEQGITSVFDKEKARQQQIKAELNAEFPNPYVPPKHKTLAEQHKEKQAVINAQFAGVGK